MKYFFNFMILLNIAILTLSSFNFGFTKDTGFLIPMGLSAGMIFLWNAQKQVHLTK